nr:hypothetical protein [Tanacetum cinerariifolium]
MAGWGGGVAAGQGQGLLGARVRREQALEVLARGIGRHKEVAFVVVGAQQQRHTGPGASRQGRQGVGRQRGAVEHRLKRQAARKRAQRPLRRLQQRLGGQRAQGGGEAERTQAVIERHDDHLALGRKPGAIVEGHAAATRHEGAAVHPHHHRVVAGSRGRPHI